MLREEHEFAPIVSDNTNARRSSRSSRSRPVDRQLALCHLAQGMVETESVPSAPPETFRFHEQRRDEIGRSQRATRGMGMSNQGTLVAESVRVSSVRAPTVRARSVRMPTPGPSIRVRSVPEDTVGEAPSTPIQPAKVENRSSASSSSDSQDLPVSAATTPDTVVSVHTSTKPRHRHSNSGDHDTISVGFVAVQSSMRRVEAYIDRRRRYNLISSGLVDELGLEVEHLSGENVLYYDEVIHVTQKTKLLWRGDQDQSGGDSGATTVVECYVCEKLQHPLIFGRNVSV